MYVAVIGGEKAISAAVTARPPTEASWAESTSPEVRAL